MSGGYIEGNGPVTVRIDPTERLVTQADIRATAIYFETLLSLAADNWLTDEDSDELDCD